MPEGVLQKIHLLLDEAEPGEDEILSRGLSSLFPYVNLTCNLYLFTADLPGSMRRVEKVQEIINSCLQDHLFLRFYVHLVHAAPTASLETIKQCYNQLKRMNQVFDEEGYQHQELPRLMLLPLLVPEVRTDPAMLEDLLETLKGFFLMPSLFLDEASAFLLREDTLMAKTEKVYIGRGSFTDMEQVLIRLCEHIIFEESCDQLMAGTPFIAEPCSSGLVAGVKDGLVYPCMEGFRKKEGIAASFNEADMDDVVAGCDRRIREERDCIACRERVLRSLVDLPFPQEEKHEVGALLYHFGTFRQLAENHVEAIKDYQQSLKVSAEEESGFAGFRLGLSYAKTGDFDRAIEAFRKAEDIYQDQDYFHFHQGTFHFDKGDYGAALEAFSKAAALDPEPEDRVRILVYMGTCHNCLGEYEKACVSLKQARKIAPDVKEIFSALGFSCFQLKDYDQAIENLRRAVEIDPRSAMDYASLGANYREKGEVSMAVAMFEKALSLDPDLAAARENLQKLKDIQ